MQNKTSVFEKKVVTRYDKKKWRHGRKRALMKKTIYYCGP